MKITRVERLDVDIPFAERVREALWNQTWI